MQEIFNVCLHFLYSQTFLRWCGNTLVSQKIIIRVAITIQAVIHHFIVYIIIICFNNLIQFLLFFLIPCCSIISWSSIQVERTWDLVRDSGQRKLTYSSQNHCTLHFVSVGAKPLSPRQCAPSRSVYLSRRLYSHWERLVITHHLQKWESSRLR